MRLVSERPIIHVRLKVTARDLFWLLPKAEKSFFLAPSLSLSLSLYWDIRRCIKSPEDFYDILERERIGYLGFGVDFPRPLRREQRRKYFFKFSVFHGRDSGERIKITLNLKLYFFFIGKLSCN